MPSGVCAFSKSKTGQGFLCPCKTTLHKEGVKIFVFKKNNKKQQALLHACCRVLLRTVRQYPQY
ncbi:retinol dehydrogenase [Acetobacter orientalis]|uniref:Retinol dehydrogenase n=1 Tax=Acetobacter orientalis TaxID=146474 RepID=A0A2Z5ZKC1_9PROT|nr:retinol dehydrogenase [Acetobacter orientalis]